MRAAIVILALSGCNQPTQGLISVRTNARVEEMLDQLVLSVEGDRRVIDRAQLPPQPWTFGVLPKNGATNTVIRVSALRDSETIATGSAKVSFDEGALLDVDIFLVCERCANREDDDDEDSDRACEGAWSFGPRNVDPCGAEPRGVVSLGPGDHTYDTDSALLIAVDGSMTSLPHGLVRQQDGGPRVRLVSIEGFDLAYGGRLRIIGSHPLYLAVHGSAIVDGSIEVAAGSSVGCGEGSGQPGGDSTRSDSGGGGGGGGGFGAPGGSGGDGAGSARGLGGGAGSDARGADLEPLYPGCNGGSGGGVRDESGVFLAERSPGGLGGGAMQLAARDRIEVTGLMFAWGLGGSGGRIGSGILGGGAGGGAGAGGAIFLESDQIYVSEDARICAPGGSGGNGAIAAIPGADGPAEVCTAGGGLDGFPGATSGGGGGGGGAEGRIRIRARDRRLFGAIVPTPAP